MRLERTLVPLILFAACAESYDPSYAPSVRPDPAVPTGDRFSVVGTNPFVETEHDPFSTFAIDVDTASYDIFRRDVESNTLTNPSSVRLEEYVNSFAYAYPVPERDAEVPFSVSLGGVASLSGAGTAIVRVGLQAKAPLEAERRAANLVFLIDTSCSMQGADRLGLVQTVLRSAVENLAEDDTLAIVTYAGNTRVALPATPAWDRDTILRVIDSFTAAGSTAGAAGIDLAYEQATLAFKPDGFNHVLLCTDGDFNIGRSSDAELLELIREKRDSGITLTVLGFGSGNLNDAMMEAVSNAGNGFYSVISGEARAQAYGAGELFATIELLARDVKVQVEFNPTHIRAYRLLGYENRLIADESFRDDTVDGGEMGSGHRVTALYQVVRTGAEIPSPVGTRVVSGPPILGDRGVLPEDAVTVRVRYKAPRAGDQDAALEVVSSLVPSALEANAAGDDDTRFAAAVAAFAEVVKNSPFGDAAQLDKIQAIAVAQAGRDAGRAEFADLLAKWRRLSGR